VIGTAYYIRAYSHQRNETARVCLTAPDEARARKVVLEDWLERDYRIVELTKLFDTDAEFFQEVT
jgi:hypothetical protein